MRLADPLFHHILLNILLNCVQSETQLRILFCTRTGGSTEEAQASIGVDVAAKLISYINHGKSIGAVNFPEIDLPPTAGHLRLLNVHRNVPGVLRGINTVLADYNVSAQVRSQIEKLP